MGIEILSQRASINYKKRKRKPREGFPSPNLSNNLVDFLDALRAGSAFGGFLFEFDLLARFSGAVAIHHKSRIMEEDIMAVFGADEAKAFFLVEILDSSLHEFTFLVTFTNNNFNKFTPTMKNCLPFS